MYEERWAKVGVRWSEAGDTVKYKLKKTFIFRQDLSGQLTEDDRVTLPNVPLFVSIVYRESNRNQSFTCSVAS